MIRPANFGYNSQTAENNTFQSNSKNDSISKIAGMAIMEFDDMVNLLRSKGIEIIVINDSKTPVKPDAIFPNNWISFHGDGAVITYPMFAPNRRSERRVEIIEKIEESYKVTRRYTFEHYEEEEMYLEGTGSMLLDRENKIVYACLSHRTDIRLLDKFCVLRGWKKVVFHAVDQIDKPIYHTNVMMAIGLDFAVVCTECIKNEEELAALTNSLIDTNKTIIDISYKQVKSFAGNMLQVENKDKETFLIMSKSAHDSLSKKQINVLSGRNEIVVIDIPTIEYYGGGSVRCMMAEMFLAKNED